MADFEDKVKVATKKAKFAAKKTKKAIIKRGKKVIGACQKSWVKLKKNIKDRHEKNKRVEYLGDRR
ncbi:hypothetical protein Fmac_012196 [Flemingia macrophylla]|uniref:Uncharacterized protein n=1 Tax=Flemingia macrophylla TaxID=520843 RepID=A0ABD1MPM9_9FABA